MKTAKVVILQKSLNFYRKNKGEYYLSVMVYIIK